MMSQESSMQPPCTQPPDIQPPRIAVWLVGLFASDKEAESIPGDLLEEFSHLASQSGVAAARGWYWRQTVKTIAHLFGAGFRGAPWPITAAMVGGFLLHGFLHGLPDKVLSAVTDKYLTFWSTHLQAYKCVLSGMAITHLILSMFVGCMVALAVKGREMVATMTLALVFCAMTGAALVVEIFGRSYLGPYAYGEIAWLLRSCADPLAMVVGGVIVRTLLARNRGTSPKRLGMTGV
jgi:hypothetical protein